MSEIRDLIYFDFGRAASLLSQIEGGLLQETQVGAESAKNERNIRKYDLKIFILSLAECLLKKNP